MNKSLIIIVTPLLLLISSCASLKLSPPGPENQTLLIMPVSVVITSQTRRHGFYYIYKIVSENDNVDPYDAVIKLPISGDMLIVNSLPPGDYAVKEFKFLTKGSGDFTYGDNVFPRNDEFKLEYGRITLFRESLNVSLYNKIPGRGMSTSYSFNMVPVTLDQKQQVLTTLRSLPNFDKWELSKDSF